MVKNNKKPRLRFKGFTDEWEQRKLGELGCCQSGIGFPDKEQGGEIGIPFYKVSDMNIYGNEQEMLISNNYVTLEQIQKMKWRPIYDVPSIIFAKVGAAVMLNRKRLCRKPFLIDNNTMAYKLSNKWDINYCKIEFERLDLTKYIQIGALPSYNGKDVENIETIIPKNLNEQTKIGNFFYNLDNLITLHQRKYDKLLNVKKALLDKMFSKNQEKTPKIRFKGFFDAWEQRKLKDFIIYKSSSLTIKDSDINGEYDLYDANSIIGKTNWGQISSDYISIIKDGAGVGRIRLMQKNSAILGTMGALITEQCCLKFIFSLLTQNDLSQKYSGSTIPHIYFKDYGEDKYYMPNSIEQTKIGDFFYNLDNLITLHQRKCEKLKNIKKALLDKMFV